MKLHKSLMKADTSHKQESFERQIALTDEEIDGLVYELYGFTVTNVLDNGDNN